MSEYGVDSIRKRMNKERDEFCNQCSFYRGCVTRNYYCPPYSLAVRWMICDSFIYNIGGNYDGTFRNFEDRDDYRNKILAEILAMKEKGEDYLDFCIRCKYSKFNNKKGTCYTHKVHGAKYGCPAMMRIYDIPCPL